MHTFSATKTKQKTSLFFLPLHSRTKPDICARKIPHTSHDSHSLAPLTHVCEKQIQTKTRPNQNSRVQTGAAATDRYLPAGLLAAQLDAGTTAHGAGLRPLCDVHRLRLCARRRNGDPQKCLRDERFRRVAGDFRR